MEQLLRLAPLVRAELPRLTSGHHTDHSFPARTNKGGGLYDHSRDEVRRRQKEDVPRIRAKLVQRLDPVDDKILELPLTLGTLTALVAVHDDDVLHARVALGGRTLFYHSRLLEDGLFEELTHVPERDERCGRGGDDDDWDFVPYAVRSCQSENIYPSNGRGTHWYFYLLL
jgi:hypothetical protein